MIAVEERCTAVRMEAEFDEIVGAVATIEKGSLK